MKKLITTQIIFLISWHNINAQVSLNNFALTGISIIDANHQTPLAHQTVLVTHNLIGNIFTDGSNPIPDSFDILPMEGKYLLPGLIDTHVHLATDPSETDNRPHTLNVLKQMLFSGITSVRDMAGDARTLAGLSRDALTGDIISPNIYYSALMAGPVFFSDPRTLSSAKGGISGKMPYMLAVTDSTDMMLAVAQAKGSGATGIKLYANLSKQLVGKITDEAKKQGMLVWSHAWLEGARPSDLVKSGVSSISHTVLMIYEKMDSIPSSWKHIPPTARFWNDSIPDLSLLFKMMKEHHTILDATMLVYKKWGSMDTAMQYDYEIEKRITAKAYKAGVTICAGTDDDQEEFVQKEMQLMVTDAAFTPIDAIIAATLHGAQALQIDKTHGTIDKNKTADLIILNKNPLTDISNVNSVFLIVKDGRIFKK